MIPQDHFDEILARFRGHGDDQDYRSPPIPPDAWSQFSISFDAADVILTMRQPDGHEVNLVWSAAVALCVGKALTNMARAVLVMQDEGTDPEETN